MPSLRMKTKSSTGSLREKNGLWVCQKSSMICKRPCSHVRISPQGAEFDSSNVEVASQVFEINGDSAQQLSLDEDDSGLQKQLPVFVDSTTVGRMESAHTCASNLETIFSPFLEPIQLRIEPNFDNDAGSNDGPEVPASGADDRADNKSSVGSQTCNVSDFFISDMIITSIPFDGNAVDDNISGTNSFPDFMCSEPRMLFDVAEQYMILPFLEDTVKANDINDVNLQNEALMAQDNTGLCPAIDQMRSCIKESDVNADSGQADDFDPQSFIKSLPELSDVVSSFRPAMVPTEAWRRKPITLVLDLDETLVHSTVEHCDDADFTFTVFFNMKEHTLYVKQRPHLQTFLEKVAEMFEIVIFTASQSIYAEQLLDILDSDRKLISRRVYRESCIFSDGSYTKDLTVLGVDLAKVAIIDNSPQVFRLQVNNGIPIKSWFDDPSDCALISLLPFLETLVDVDDVRPLIAKKFGVSFSFAYIIRRLWKDHIAFCKVGEFKRKGHMMNITRLSANGKIIDPFHEVKSKRDKKKETKDTVYSRSRGANNLGSRGGRSGSDRYIGRGGSSHYSSNESGPSHGKPAPKRENGTHAHAESSSSASGMQGNTMKRRPPSHSEVAVTENKMSTVGLGDGVSSSSQPYGYQSAWLGVPGQVSMADIVKMGRPQNKASDMPNPPHQSVNNQHLVVPPSAALHPNLHSPQHHASRVSDVTYEPDVTTKNHVSPSDEWPPIENPSAVSVTTFLEAPADSGLYANDSNISLDSSNHHIKSQLEEAQPVDDGPVEIVNGNVVSSPTSSRKIQEDDSGLYKDVNSYKPQRHAIEHDEAEDGSSSVSNLQQLNLHDDDQKPSPEEDNPSVIIPNHLQVHTPDCSHLSFGSFGPGISSAFSGTFASRPLKNNLDEVPEAADASSIGHSDDRNPEYYGDEHLRSNTEENVMNGSNVSTGNYEASEDSRSEVLKQDASEAAQGSQYTFPSSVSGYSYENSQQFDPAFTHTQTSSQMQNLTPFSSVMHAYTNSLPSTLLTSTVQTAREQDLPYSPFPVTQSMPARYSNAASSISGPTISMPEALRAASISAPQPTQQALPGASVATGPALPQHLAMHPFSQPTLPLGHFANMISYPFLPQSYTYMPSAYQQAFAGNSNYPQSLATVLPQYKNSVSVSSLPQSTAIPSGYGFGSATSIPGGLPLNPPTAPAGTTIGYDDVLSSQYKDSNHLMSLQQNENSAMWIHGPGSRTMSAVPASTYYSFQGHNQQAGGFRQGQQPSQHFGALGYPNFYHSQTGVSLEHQQQNPMDGSLSGSQGQPSKLTQQLWQNNY
ncbi:uncharacterized protein LOC111280770 isoform X3 [Durio zibethinus]|uniref:Uncharacterized protein LOC111280770 isoform X3 n=1 Tax=Durio zibethinus TaxID=66656 RepID=A0A6P5X8N0_DURZI|nr:uncharacterized protein LOC111280770 isoform X3 [Durio zibethinus]